jgi:ZIP family zinc transporter
VLTLLAVAGGAALASVAGGALALARRPTSLFMSIAFGAASGVLLGTVTLQMLPEAQERASPGAVVAGATAGVLLVWGLDLYVNRGRLAGEQADQWKQVSAFHRRHRPRGDGATVLAGGTSAEELIEGLAIGAGLAVEPEVGVLIGAAIAIDNLCEGLSIGELVLASSGLRRTQAVVARTLRWCTLVGAALFVASLGGWLALRDAAEPVLGALLATGAGGMLYLTVTQLVPPGQARQYEGSAALATWLGFALMLLLVEAA